MQIVTDTAMDLFLPPEEMPKGEIHIIRQVITFRCAITNQIIACKFMDIQNKCTT